MFFARACVLVLRGSWLRRSYITQLLTPFSDRARSSILKKNQIVLAVKVYFDLTNFVTSSFLAAFQSQNKFVVGILHTTKLYNVNEP